MIFEWKVVFEDKFSKRSSSQKHYSYFYYFEKLVLGAKYEMTPGKVVIDEGEYPEMYY